MLKDNSLVPLDAPVPDGFRELASRFDRIAATPYATAVAIAGEIDRAVVVAVRTLNRASDGGLFGKYTRLRDSLYNTRIGDGALIDFFARRSCADWHRGEAAAPDPERDRLLGLWTTATGGSWLAKDYPDEFDSDDPGLDWSHHVVDPKAKYIIEVMRRGTERWIKATPAIAKMLRSNPLPDTIDKLEAHGHERRFRQRLPDGAIRCAEGDCSETPMIERNRARANFYARACRLLSRIAERETGVSTDQDAGSEPYYPAKAFPIKSDRLAHGASAKSPVRRKKVLGAWHYHWGDAHKKWPDEVPVDPPKPVNLGVRR
jgi:hypothetical protein